MNKKMLEHILTHYVLADIIKHYVEVCIDGNSGCKICPLYNKDKCCPNADMETLYPKDCYECEKMLMKAVLNNE